MNAQGERMNIINSQQWYAYLVAGAKNIVVNEMNLNRINVFPVPDGDTGTNLSLTMNMMIHGVKIVEHVGEQTQEFASLALNHAYGNSGMIFAQYLHGLSLAFQDKVSITSNDLVKGFQLAFDKARQSVASPKEGTILTVMRFWAQAWEKHMNENVADVFENLLIQLSKAVSNTTEQLKVLKDHNVVDAGAMAFYYFMQGIHRFIQTKKLDDIIIEASTLDIVDEIIMSADVGEYRYCAQYLVKPTHHDSTLKSTLDSLGDSLVMNEQNEMLSIHIHTNEPHTIMKICVELGHVLSHKVDDMWLQANMIHKPVSKLAILTDSIADVPQSMIDEHHCVVIPLNLIIDSVVYMDKITIKSTDFYKHLDDYTLNPTSSQPTIASIERSLKSLLQHYDEIIGIFVSSKMSGTINTIQKALHNLKSEDKRITLIDSKVNSIAQGLVVSEACRVKALGWEYEQIINHIHSVIQRVRIYVSVKDLKYMIKGGRVSKNTGIILSALKLQPVISIDNEGKGIIPFKSLSQKSAIKSILKTLKKDAVEHGIERYALVYTDNLDDLKLFSEQVKAIVHQDPEYIETISPIVGLNAGKGAIAIGYIMKESAPL